MSASIAPPVRSHYFTWRHAILGRYDILHVHWLDSFLYGQGRSRTVLVWVGSFLVLARLRLMRTPVVRTLHNKATRGNTHRRIVRRIIDGLDRLTVVDIEMNRSDAGRPNIPRVYIPHGHYRDWYARYGQVPTVPGRLLNFGLIRDYKGIDRLVDAFGGLASSDASLHVVGRVVDVAVGRHVSRAAAEDTRLVLRDGHASDADLVTAISESQLVVLPYEDFFNSGCLMLSLTLGRPVLLPDGEAAEEMRREFGREWIYTYPGVLEADHLAEALVATGDANRPAQVPMDHRDWHVIGARLTELYVEVANGRQAGHG